MIASVTNALPSPGEAGVVRLDNRPGAVSLRAEARLGAQRGSPANQPFVETNRD